MKTFITKSHGYSVNYPGSWSAAGDPDALYIFDFPRQRSVRGAVLPSDGAAIRIFVPEQFTNFRASAPATIDEWAASGIASADRVVERGRFDVIDGSRRITGIQLRTVSGEGASALEGIDWYFAVEDRMFVAALFYRSGNPNLGKLRDTLKQVALSLRVFR